MDTYIKQSRLLSGLALLLQSCEREKDIFDVAHCYLPQLFPGFKGAIHLAGASDDTVSTPCVWPDENEVSSPNLPLCHAFSSTSAIDSAFTSDPKCKECQCGQFCLPLRDGNRSFGLFCLDYSENLKITSHQKGLVFITAEYLALSLTNIRLKKHLYDLSTRDPLTQLYNRRHLDQVAVQEVSRATRSGLPLGVIIIDLDFFKKINDTLGHDAGDLVLQGVAETVGRNTRSEDIVCRYGGEEFIVLLGGSNVAESFKRAEHLRHAIKNMDIQYKGESIGVVTASLGVATFPLHGTTFTEVVKAADQALYVAKESGRDKVVAAESSSI